MISCLLDSEQGFAMIIVHVLIPFGNGNEPCNRVVEGLQSSLNPLGSQLLSLLTKHYHTNIEASISRKALDFSEGEQILGQLLRHWSECVVLHTKGTGNVTASISESFPPAASLSNPIIPKVITKGHSNQSSLRGRVRVWILISTA